MVTNSAQASVLFVCREKGYRCEVLEFTGWLMAKEQKGSESEIQLWTLPGRDFPPYRRDCVVDLCMSVEFFFRKSSGLEKPYHRYTWDPHDYPLADDSRTIVIWPLEDSCSTPTTPSLLLVPVLSDCKYVCVTLQAKALRNRFYRLYRQR